MGHYIKKTVTVELLRHGKAHNQLLSPLTEYLGLCGNFGATLVRVPYEQQQFLSRLSVLRYSDGQGSDSTLRENTLTETAEEMTGILESLRGLISELGTADGDPCGIVHLNMVLSAAELSMLPFELSNVPPGCAGGEGSPLLLQNRLRVSMTRQVRNVTNINIQWPKKPKILFIVAAPGALGVPVREHANELINTIAPWVNTHVGGDREKLIKSREELLTIVTDATRQKIEQATRQNQFTHVHILAHGMADRDNRDKPFGLALHDAQNPNQPDIVDGKTLVALLSPLNSECSQLPSVVTVASCDSGNTRSLINSNGSSLAHDLHRAGIPFVVASQFPLSKRASKYMPRVLYQSLLWGQDPRIAVAQLRQELKVHCPKTHDWASVVCYASLPEDIDSQLRELRYEQSKRAINAAMGQIDDIIKASGNSDEKQSQDIDQDLVNQLFELVDAADAKMPTDGGYETEGMGMKASNHKRRAEVEFNLADIAKGKAQKEKFEESLLQLKLAKKCYEQAYRTNFMESKEALVRKSVHWVLGQYLSVCTILGEEFKPLEWGAAKVSSDIDLRQDNNLTIAWAHGSLAELYLLLLAYPEQPGFATHSQSRALVLQHVSSLIKRVDADDFAIGSTLRQFKRYTKWWGQKEFRKLIDTTGEVRSWNINNGVVKVADEAVQLLEQAQMA